MKKIVDHLNPSNTSINKTPMVSSSLLITLIVGVLAFATGYLTSQVKTLSANKTTNTVTQAGTQQAAAQPNAAPISLDKIKALFTDKNITSGEKNSKLLLVEFLDPSCPYCHVGGGKDPELAKQIGTQFTYDTDGGTYKPPVTEMKKLVDAGKASMVTLYATGHGNGKLAMEALYCANEQGKYWDAHDLLMSNAGYNLQNDTVKNDRAKIPELVSFLSSNVDANQLTDCLNTKKYESKVIQDDQLGREYGVSGTPAFFVNTASFKGAYNWTDMQSAANSALGQ
ncbi:MAG: DsbA family protein [Patescibacteria group bacterium]